MPIEKKQSALIILVVSVALFLCPVRYTFVVAIWIVYLIYSYQCPQAPLYLLILLTPFAQKLHDLDIWCAPALLLMVYWAVFNWFFKLRTLKRFYEVSMYYKEFNLFFLLFVVLIILSSINTTCPGQTLKEAAVHIAGFLTMFYCLGVLKDENHLKKAVYVFLSITLFIASLSCLQFVIMKFHVFLGFEKFLIPADDRMSLFRNDVGGSALGNYRTPGTFDHSNALGAYLALGFPFFLSLFLLAKMKIGKRVLVFFFMGIIMISIFVSGSRGGLVNVVSSSLFLVAMSWKLISKRAKIIGSVLIFLIMGVFPSYIISFLRFSAGVSNRDVIWQNTLQMISEHPIVGHGMGGFSQEYFARFGSSSQEDIRMILGQFLETADSSIFKGFHAHNLFLNYAFEMGLIAPFVFLFFYISYFRKFIQFKIHCLQDHGFIYAMIMGAVGAVVGSFIHSFFETIGFTTISFSYSLIFVVSVGIVLMHQKLITCDVKG